MGELMALLVTSVLVNNVILTQFLGMCPFMGVSKKKKSSAIGMGVAVVFVIVVLCIGYICTLLFSTCTFTT